MDTSENESGSRKDSSPDTSVNRDRWIDISCTWPLFFFIQFASPFCTSVIVFKHYLFS